MTTTKEASAGLHEGGDLEGNHLESTRNNIQSTGNAAAVASYQHQRSGNKPLPRIDNLPPLPTPDFNSKRRETIGGIAVVSLFLLLFIGLTHGVALTAVVGSINVARSTGVYKTFLALIYTEAICAILCHVGILWRDPGVIRRSSATCFPIPEKMQEWVEAYSAGANGNQEKQAPQQQQSSESAVAVEQKRQSSSDQGKEDVASKCDIEAGNGISSAANLALSSSSAHDDTSDNNNENPETATSPDTQTSLQKPPDLYIAGPDGRVYCTRCLVWRQPGINHYHCQTCQRCVGYYDHHCSFFGRCIAGTVLCHNRDNDTPILRGNYIFFVGIVAMGAMGYLTTIAALLYSLSLRFGVKWVLPIGFVILLWVHTTIMKRSPRGLCMLCRRWIVDTCECIRKCVLNKR